MNDSQWDAKLKSFLKKTGDDFKRFGTEVKEEAQKLLTEVQDPARQQKLRDGLKDVGVWAKKTAEDVATLVETGVKKTEAVLEKAGEKVSERVTHLVTPDPEAPATPAPTPPSAPPEMETPATPKTPKKKTVGKAATRKKAAPAAKAGGKKTIGKKPKGG